MKNFCVMPIICDKASGCILELFCDVNLGGCLYTAKSTIGLFLVVRGSGGTNFLGMTIIYR
jgi:hypothetical protein